MHWVTGAPGYWFTWCTGSQVTGAPVYWVTGSLVHRVTGSPGAPGHWFTWCTGSLGHQCTGLLVHLVHRCTESLVHPVHWCTRCTGSLVHQVTGAPGHWVTGATGHWFTWCTGSLVHLVHRVTGSPVHRVTGSPVHRVTGSPGALPWRCTGSLPMQSFLASTLNILAIWRKFLAKLNLQDIFCKIIVFPPLILHDYYTLARLIPSCKICRLLAIFVVLQSCRRSSAILHIYVHAYHGLVHLGHLVTNAPSWCM